MLRRRLTAVAIAGLAAAVIPGDAHADDPVVHLDTELQQFDRRLPSSQQFVLEVKVPGKEVVRGQLELWPVPAGGGCKMSPTSEKQHHVLAMVAAGADADRALRATVPPLQVDTSFCFAVRIFRGLDDVQAVGFAAQVTGRLFSSSAALPSPLKVDISTTCAAPDPRSRFEQAIGRAIDDVSRRHVENEKATLDQATLAVTPAAFVAAAGPAPAKGADVDLRLPPTIEPAITESDRTSSSRSIAKAVLDGLALETLCGAVVAADQESMIAGAVVNRANDDVIAAAARLPLLRTTNPVTARLPLFVSGTPLTVRRYDQLLPQDAAIPAAAVELEAHYAGLASLLHDVENAKPDARAAAYKAYQDKLKTLTPQPVELVYLRAGSLTKASFEEVFPSQRVGESESDWRQRKALAQEIVLNNLDLLKREMSAFDSDDHDARAWFDALVALEGPVQASQSANTGRTSKEGAAVVARQASPMRSRAACSRPMSAAWWSTSQRCRRCTGCAPCRATRAPRRSRPTSAC